MARRYPGSDFGTWVLAALGLLVLGALADPGPALAQDDALRRARDAYAGVDFGGTREAARAALDSGALEPAQVAEMYRLLGLASAALGETEGARDAFVRLLALDPEARLERDLSPALRSPYMEARGYWARYPTRLSLEVSLRDGAVHVRTDDPAELANRVRVRLRATGDATFVVEARERAPAVEVEAPAARVEAVVELLDEAGNVLTRRGSEEQPLRLGEPLDVQRPADARVSAEPIAAPADRTPLLVAGVAALLAGAGGLALGAVFHAEREALAQDWNDATAACTGAGVRREDVCDNVRSDLGGAEVLMGVGYGVGGALALIGTILLVAGARGDDAPAAEAGFACAPDLGGLSCAGRF